MALLSKAKPGRADGGYTRILGSAELGALISQVHACSISAGSELERIVPRHALTFKPTDISAFIGGTLQNGNYLVTKKSIREHFKSLISSTIEPDFLIICVVDTKIFIVELKDGDAFDTKKCRAEIEHLSEFTQKMKQWLCKNATTAAYSVDYRMCFFNAQSKDAVVLGMKGQLAKSRAWTGADFCKFLGISYTDIVEKRNHEAAANLDHFLKCLAAIPQVRERLETLLAQRLDSRASEACSHSSTPHTATGGSLGLPGSL